MADTKSLHQAPPVEGDGVSYSGIVWFVVILVVTTVFCQLLVWGLFEVMEMRDDRARTAPAPLAVPASPATGPVTIEKYIEQAGRRPSGPTLLSNEPLNLREFRNREHAALTTYGWADKATETIRLPIGRAKELLLERGLPIRAAAPAPTPAGAAPAAGGKP
jgi:hypothetical protein